MPAIYILDTNNCQFIMRERLASVLEKTQEVAANQHQIVISVITYYEMLLGAVGRNASPRHARLVDAFVTRLLHHPAMGRGGGRKGHAHQAGLDGKGNAHRRQ